MGIMVNLQMIQEVGFADKAVNGNGIQNLSLVYLHKLPCHVPDIGCCFLDFLLERFEAALAIIGPMK